MLPSGSRMWRLWSTNVMIRSPTPYGGVGGVWELPGSGALFAASSVAAVAPHPLASSAHAIARPARNPFSA
jgi:hypothetical protein